MSFFKMKMACLARASLEVGGGVCSKMAYATTGALTTLLPPGSEIVQVFHRNDHEFVIARVPGSRWFVVDPWPHEPKVIPFVDCVYKPLHEDTTESAINSFIAMEVTKTMAEPYGFNLDKIPWDNFIRESQHSDVPIFHQVD